MSGDSKAPEDDGTKAGLWSLGRAFFQGKLGLGRTILVSVFGLLIVLSLFPIWWVRYAPIPDLSTHLAGASVWFNYANPAFDFPRYYDLQLGLNSYCGYYVLMRVLAPLFGLDAANRLLLSFYIVAIPAGMTWLAVRFERSPWLGLLSFPFLWTFCFNFGFVPNCLGLAFVPLGLAVFDWHCAKPTLLRGAAASLLGIIIFVCHVVPWVLYCAAAGFIGLLHKGRTLRRLAGRFVAWLIPVAFVLLAIYRGKGKGMGGGLAHFKFRWEEWGHNPMAWFGSIIDHTWNWCSNHEDMWFGLLLGLSWLALQITASDRRPTLHKLRALACFIAAAAAVFLLPHSIIAPANLWGMNYRLAAWMLLFATLLIPGAIIGWRRWLLVPAVLAGIGFAVDTTQHWVRANQFMAGFDEVTALPPPGARVLFIMRKPFRDSSAKLDYAQSWPAFYLAHHGAYSPWLFNDFPLRFRRWIPAPHWQTMAFNWEMHAPYWDYVATFQESAGGLFGQHLGEVTHVADAGKWSLWKLPGPRREP